MTRIATTTKHECIRVFKLYSILRLNVLTLNMACNYIAYQIKRMSNDYLTLLTWQFQLIVKKNSKIN